MSPAVRRSAPAPPVAPGRGDLNPGGSVVYPGARHAGQCGFSLGQVVPVPETRLRRALLEEARPAVKPQTSSVRSLGSLAYPEGPQQGAAPDEHLARVIDVEAPAPIEGGPLQVVPVDDGPLDVVPASHRRVTTRHSDTVGLLGGSRAVWHVFEPRKEPKDAELGTK